MKWINDYTRVPVYSSPRMSEPIYLVGGIDPMNAYRLDSLVLPMVREMHRYGLLVDMGRINAAMDKLAGDGVRLDQEITGTFGVKDLNCKSAPQCRTLLFDQMGLHNLLLADKVVPEAFLKTEGGQWSTRDDVLQLFLPYCPEVKLIADRREISTLISNFLIKMPRYRGLDGRIHPTFKLAHTATGRFSCENPPLQTLPSHSIYSALIRSCFVARPGYKIVSGDFSQIEMWLAGVLSGDMGLIRVFLEKLDIHTITAAMMFGLDPSQVERKTHRLYAKTVNFGVLYGMAAFALMVRIIASGGAARPVAECERYISRWYEIYEQVAIYLDMVRSGSRRLGYTHTICGHIRPTPQSQMWDERVREQGYRQAGNGGIQGSGADLTKLAMAMIWDILAETWNKGLSPDECPIRPLLQIHDELVFEVREDLVHEFEPVFHSALVEADSGILGSEWGLPIGAEIGVGNDLGEVK